MGIYIKDMEMPKDADEYRLIIRANGQVIIDKKTYWEETEAVPIPSYRRLIDADELMKKIKDLKWSMEGYYVYQLLKDAPTIIETEKGE